MHFSLGFVEGLGQAYGLCLENPGFALNFVAQSRNSLEEGHETFMGAFSGEGFRAVKHHLVLLSSKGNCALPVCIDVCCSMGWM